jgi:hypothetical protein
MAFSKKVYDTLWDFGVGVLGLMSWFGTVLEGVLM